MSRSSTRKGTHDDIYAFLKRTKVGDVCGSCDVPGSEVALKKCSACKIIKYCSKSCQASHWKVHKEYCNTNAKHAATLAQADRDGSMSRFIPPGVTLTELDSRLDKWIKFHVQTLMAATVHALGLDHDIGRTRTHVMNMLIRHRTDHENKRGKFFRIVKAEAVEMSVAEGYAPAWVECMQRFRKLREESERDGKGTVAAIVLECPPLSLLLVPFTPMLDSRRTIIQEWREFLIEDVEKGKVSAKFIL